MHELLHAFAREVYPDCPIDFATLQSHLSLREVKGGEFLFREGDVCSFVGITRTGCLRSFFLSNGKEITLFFHPERQTLGDYESMQRQHPAYFSCQAIEDSTVLLINKEVITAIEILPGGQKLLRLVVEELAFQLRNRLLSLYRDSPEKRYTGFLEAEPVLAKRISQQHIASYIGVEPESLSRLKRRLRDRAST